MANQVLKHPGSLQRWAAAWGLALLGIALTHCSTSGTTADGDASCHDCVGTDGHNDRPDQAGWDSWWPEPDHGNPPPAEIDSAAPSDLRETTQPDEIEGHDQVLDDTADVDTHDAADTEPRPDIPAPPLDQSLPEVDDQPNPPLDTDADSVPSGPDEIEHPPVDIPIGPTCPPLTVSIVDPTPAEVLNGLVTLRVMTTGAAQGCWVLGVEFYVDNLQIGTDVIGSPQYTMTFDSKDYEDAEHVISVITANNLGELASDTVSVRFDNTPPQLLSKEPQEGDCVFFEDGPLHVSVAVDDPDFIRNVSFRANGLPMGEFDDPPFAADIEYDSLFIDLISLPQNIFVQFSVKDQLNQETTAESNVTVHRRYRWNSGTIDQIWASAAATPEGNIVFGNKESRLFVLSPAGNLLYGRAVSGEIITAPTVDPSSGRIFYGAQSGDVGGLSSDLSSSVWTVNLGSPPSGDLILQNGLVHVVTFEGGVYALNASNGATSWHQPLGGMITTSPTMNSSNVLYVGCWDQSLYAINSGAIQWTFPTDNVVAAPPALGSDQTLYIGNNSGRVYAVIDQGGFAEQRWNRLLLGQVWTRPLLASDGGLIVLTNAGHAYKLDLDDGGQVWDTDVDEGLSYSSPVEGPDGKIYFGTTFGNLVCLDSASGDILWRMPLADDTIHATPLLLNDALYLGSWDMNLYSLWVRCDQLPQP